MYDIIKYTGWWHPIAVIVSLRHKSQTIKNK